MCLVKLLGVTAFSGLKMVVASALCLVKPVEVTEKVCLASKHFQKQGSLEIGSAPLHV